METLAAAQKGGGAPPLATAPHHGPPHLQGHGAAHNAALALRRLLLRLDEPLGHGPGALPQHHRHAVQPAGHGHAGRHRRELKGAASAATGAAAALALCYGEAFASSFKALQATYSQGLATRLPAGAKDGSAGQLWPQGALAARRALGRGGRQTPRLGVPAPARCPHPQSHPCPRSCAAHPAPACRCRHPARQPGLRGSEGAAAVWRRRAPTPLRAQRLQHSLQPCNTIASSSQVGRRSPAYRPSATRASSAALARADLMAAAAPTHLPLACKELETEARVQRAPRSLSAAAAGQPLLLDARGGFRDAKNACCNGPHAAGPLPCAPQVTQLPARQAGSTVATGWKLGHSAIHAWDALHLAFSKLLLRMGVLHEEWHHRHSCRCRARRRRRALVPHATCV